jgi:uncharacterized protein (TIGR02246 family)
MALRTEIEGLYETLLRCWNTKDAAAYAALFAEEGVVVGFDGTSIESPSSIRGHLESIFADHDPATYVAIVEDVRLLGAGVALLRGAAGMVPPGSNTIKSEVNTQQTLVAIEADDGWHVALFQNTPARFDGRPEAVATMTRELQAAYDRSAVDDQAVTP